MGSFANDLTGGLTGETSAARGARKAGEQLQAGALQAQETLTEAAAPFAQLGTGAGSELSSFLGLPSQPSAQSSQDQARLSELIAQRDKIGRAGGGLIGGMINKQRLPQINEEIAQLESSIASAPQGQQSSNQPFTLQQSSQNVLNDPFFGALAADQETRLLNSAAARGRTGAGGTQDRLQQNTLLLGNQFRNQDFQSRLQANQQRFGQLFGTTQLGANAALGLGSGVAGLQTDSASAGAANAIAQGNAKMAGVTGARDLAIAGFTGGASLPFTMGAGGGGMGSFGGSPSNFGAGGSGLSSQFGDFSF